ncbi:carbon-nitrogen hydrolase family protein [Sulfobacillus harzensis]|uniref:Carbon-nitrogen hydrolase family protein n=1 Tax=Sulfobacillus harzensis TaxID=2729629 RepID=A0A7Y0L5T7_9FIRM|nr:carbon-nitrogen hydrolase family protein [Sulfobacillus harzensis]NMP23843.1 carbon-nitrogen hydrolase family protein [Sulfobacillus harzensis]
MRTRDRMTVAVVQAASVLMDREQSVQKACRYLEEASNRGADLIVFPEAFIPGYPRGLTFGSVVGARRPEGRKDWGRYWRSAVSIPSPDIDRLKEAIARTKAYVVMGVIERADHGGHATLYGTTLYFGPDGTLLGRHRKLKPTGSERLIWGEGDGSTLTAVPTPFGILGGLICWENYMPLARAAMYEKGVTLYVAPTADARDSWQATLQHIACEGRCFVIGANQYVTKHDYPEDLACAGDLVHEPEELCRGGSAIVDPLGQYLAGPLYHEEGLVVAELDLTAVEAARFDFDVTGHYARPDVFTLWVNEEPQRNVTLRADRQGVNPRTPGPA